MNIEDAEVVFYQEKFTRNCVNQFDALPYKDRLVIGMVAQVAKDRLLVTDPKSEITLEDVISLLLNVLYFCRFKESPVQTAIFSRENNHVA